MKPFLKNTVWFFLPVLVLAVALELLLRAIPNDYKNKRMYLDEHSNEVQVLILGTSHPLNDLNPAWMQLNSYNAAYVSQSIDIDLDILKKYEGKWDNLEYIITPVSYARLSERLDTSSEHWRIKNYVLYFHLNISHKITDHSEILGNKLWYNFFRIWHYYILKENPTVCIPNGWRKTFKNQEDLEKSGIERARIHTINNPVCFKENTATLESLIQYAHERGVKVILCTFPAYKTYVEHLDAEQKTKTFGFARQMAEKYDNTLYFNFLSDSTFLPEDFRDADHLNALGARKMTARIDSIIQNDKKQQNLPENNP